MSSHFSFLSLFSAAWQLSSIGVQDPVVGYLIGHLVGHKGANIIIAQDPTINAQNADEDKLCHSS
jgi:hypothetical protein